MLVDAFDLTTPEVQSDNLFDPMDDLTKRADALLKDYDNATTATATPASATPASGAPKKFKSTPRRTPAKPCGANMSVVVPRSPAPSRENAAPNFFSATASSAKKVRGKDDPRDEVTQLQFAAAMSPSRGGLFPVFKPPTLAPAAPPSAPAQQAPDTPAAELVAAVAKMLQQEKMDSEGALIDEWMAGLHAERILDDDEKLRQASVAQFGPQFGPQFVL